MGAAATVGLGAASGVAGGGAPPQAVISETRDENAMAEAGLSKRIDERVSSAGWRHAWQQSAREDCARTGAFCGIVRAALNRPLDGPAPATPLGFLRGLLGPALVVAGASMWGLETYWRLPLGRKLDADILVFHEHWLGLVLTLPFLVVGASALRGVSRKAIVSMIGSGVLGSALGTVCFTQALALLSSSLANLLLNVQPVISVLVSWAWLRERPNARFYPWALVALACGVALAWSPEALESPHRLGLGLLFIGATALCWGASTTFGRAAMMEIDFKTGTALRYLIGTVATFALAAAHGDVGARLRWGVLADPSTLRQMAGLLVVAAITPTFLYFAGLARTRASVATFAEMAQTFASLVITWGVLGDALAPHQVVAGVLLLVAVVFIHRSVDAAMAEGRATPRAPAPDPR
jgi:drug/metabolite transporter (DMT)-like permease